MYLNDQAKFMAGLAMVLVAILTMVSVVLTATSVADYDPFDRSEVAEFLTDVNDNSTPLYATAAVGFVNDGVFVMIVAVMFFVLFRDRSFNLALLGMVGLLTGATLSIANDMVSVMLGFVARDFVEGSGTIAAGDSSAFELGRLLGMFNFAMTNVVFTPIGLGLISVGTLIAKAPLGAVNPPRWLGWVAIVAGFAYWLAWLLIVSDVFFIFFPINLLATLIFLFGTGGWLLAHRSEQPMTMATAPAAA